MVPAGESFHRCVDFRRGGELVESFVEPLLEHGELPVLLRGEDVVVGQDCSEMFDRGGLREGVECLVGQLDLPVADALEEGGGPAVVGMEPGVDTLRAFDAGEDVDQALESEVGWVCWPE